LLGRAREHLEDEERIQPLSNILAARFTADFQLQQFFMEMRFRRQREQLQQDVEMKDDQNDWSDKKEPQRRQIDVQQRQPDRAFEQQVSVRHRPDGNGEIKLERNEGRPKGRQGACGFIQCLLQLAEVSRVNFRHLLTPENWLIRIGQEFKLRLK
jgi:hypothetical protein